MRLVVFLSLLSGCGGAPFTLGSVSSESYEDASTGIDSDADPNIDKDSGSNLVETSSIDSGAVLALDSGVDSGIQKVDANPSCESLPSITENCGEGLPTSFPDSYCAYNCNGTTGCEFQTESTPPQCNSWCTFSCDCLIDAGMCPGTFIGCIDLPYNTTSPNGTVELQCKQ